MSVQWDEVKALFAACADLGGEQLEKRLAGAPDGIRREVESLLAAEKDAGAFLGSWPHAMRLGAYDLIAKIGEGGMGSVWKARRADGQFEHDAAIKIIREHCDSQANLERFRAERQLLAQLEHPNISRLLDGGTTAGGLPYFVMDLIEGSRIDVYCRELDVEQKLRVLLPVCDAVDYANRRGVLHRDLKPANILVTAEGVPKLVDFGIAKALGDEVPVTGTLERMATPEYASPEHLTGKPLTAASEVYSLGVTMYELLTGVKPYSGTGRPLPDLVRSICETAPAKPSILRQTLSTDIDNIVAKAMHKDPSRRYASAGEMAKDIERHLTGKPVLARGDSVTYRLERFVHRNRKPVGAAATAFVLGAIAWGAWSYLNVRRFTHSSLAVIAIRSELKDPALEWLERGVAETLTASLLHSGAFQVISADRVRGAANGRTSQEALDRSGQSCMRTAS
jgi:serine/threonine protein kinase